MPTRTGTPSQVDGSGGDGSTSVTVPADATGAVAMWTHFDNGTVSGLNMPTLGGNAFTQIVQIQESASPNFGGGGIAYLFNLPGTGSQTFAWTWTAGGARNTGGLIVVVWLKDVNTSDPYRAGAAEANTATTSVSATISTATDDLVLAMGCSFTQNPALDGTVFIDDSSLNSYISDVSEVTPSAGSTTVNMTNENYSVIMAASFKAAAIAGAPVGWLTA